MNAGFTTIDYVIFVIYAIVIVSLGIYLSRGKNGEQENAKDYFLAGGTLSWWAIGASLIAANISAEQFIGMSGSGYAIGLAIAAYEWMAAITLIIVAKYLLPQMIDKKIFTMPQLTSERYGEGVSFFFSFFWLLVYVFVNLTSVAWLGSLAMESILGVPKEYGVVGLLLFAGLYSIYGGLKSVAWTDVIQVVFLVGGGLITAFFALDAVSGSNGGVIDGFLIVLNSVKETANDYHFNMIIPQGVAFTADGKDIFTDLPGLAVLFGALWLANIGYWGFNQYIIQKGLAAKSLKEAKRGLIFAAYLKILIPIIVILPGITAYVMFNHPELTQSLGDLSGEITKSDQAYPWLLRNFAPNGIRGLAFAALVAAVVSSLASMLNSTSTIFTLDIYKKHINKEADDKKLVKIGRISAAIALLIAVFAAKPLLGGLDQAFQYIQEYTGLISPGVVVVFGMGIIWKRATNRAALWTTIITIPLGIVMKLLLPDLPFIIRMGYVMMILVSFAAFISLSDSDTVKAEVLSAENKSKLTRSTIFFGLLSIITLVLGIVFGTNIFGLGKMNLGFESIFMLTFVFAFLSLIMYTNANSTVQSKNAYSYNPELFSTDKKFAFSAMGIVVIIIALYAYFW